MPNVPVIPRPKHFDDRGVDIERLIMRLCKCPSLKRKGVRVATGRKLITEGRGPWGKKMTPSLRRNWKSPFGASGSGYVRPYGGKRTSPQSPGRMNLTIGGSAHPASVVELIIHEFMHCIGYDHSQEMDDLIVFAANDLWEIDFHKEINQRFFRGTYGVDAALIGWMKKNWEKISKMESTCYRHDNPIPTAASPNPEPKKSRVRVNEEERTITVRMTQKMYDQISQAMWPLAETSDSDNHELAAKLCHDCDTIVEKLKYKNRSITLSPDDWRTVTSELQLCSWGMASHEPEYQATMSLLRLIRSGERALHTYIAHNAFRRAGIELEP